MLVKSFLNSLYVLGHFLTFSWTLFNFCTSHLTTTKELPLIKTKPMYPHFSLQIDHKLFTVYKRTVLQVSFLDSSLLQILTVLK